ncbi:MAG TPA: FAD-dependent monooxygenase [Terriglobales bacterium]|nr:FAD-dependent monooxygenase [Terriglobales bacterium]
MYETNVLIVGAGPTGLTLGIELARRSIAFRLVESAKTPFAGSRGKGIQPRTLEVFHDLGIIEKILNTGMPYPEVRVHLGPLSLRLRSLGGRHQATGTIPYPNLWLVPQHRTEAILRERLAELGGQVEFGTAFESLEQEEQWVTIGLSTGESLRAKYLVGCDGGHSAVRKAVGLALNGEALSNKLPFVADVEIPNLDHAVWHIWPLAKGGPIALCPLPEESLFQMTSARTPLENLEEAVYKVCKCKVRRTHWSSSYRPASRMVAHYRVGRVFLAGDAAHLHPPTGGQGLNTGIQDAYNLGWKLASVFRGGPESLLDTYEEERLPVAAAVLGLSSQLYKKISLKRGEATNQLALHYRASSLSSGAPMGRLHPGDRMPNLQLVNGNKLFDEMRGTHATEVISETGARILVRPDGYIASMGTQPTEEYAGERTRTVQCPAGGLNMV